MSISIFISYSHRDMNAIKMNHLLKKRVDELETISDMWADSKVWWDEQIPNGEDWWRRILDQIRDCSHFIYMLSKDSVVKSPFCPEEHNWAIMMARRRIYVKTDENLRMLPNGINRFQIIGLKKDLNDTVADIIETISSTPSYPSLPKNYLSIRYPSYPPYKLSALAEKIYHFDENQDGDFLIYNLWRFIRDEDVKDDVMFLAEILREKVKSSQYRDDIDEILLAHKKPQEKIEVSKNYLDWDEASLKLEYQKK